jgi:hypothetical protein
LPDLLPFPRSHLSPCPASASVNVDLRPAMHTAFDQSPSTLLPVQTRSPQASELPPSAKARTRSSSPSSTFVPRRSSGSSGEGLASGGMVWERYVCLIALIMSEGTRKIKLIGLPIHRFSSTYQLYNISLSCLHLSIRAQRLPSIRSRRVSYLLLPFSSGSRRHAAYLPPLSASTSAVPRFNLPHLLPQTLRSLDISRLSAFGVRPCSSSTFLLLGIAPAAKNETHEADRPMLCSALSL